MSLTEMENKIYSKLLFRIHQFVSRKEFVHLVIESWEEACRIARENGQILNLKIATERYLHLLNLRLKVLDNEEKNGLKVSFTK